MSNRVDNKVLRIIDANFNRLKEGLRVCEEVARFILDDKNLTAGYKKIRHQASQITASFFVDLKRIIRARDIVKDVGKTSIRLELKRSSFKDIFFANIQRAKESVRVMEEFNKLFSKASARKFKALRYKIYELEKKTIKKLEALRSAR
ncbi:MAG: thiamine-phosphate pyrophosphorylase [Candidatus Omnitrophota bacterium]